VSFTNPYAFWRSKARLVEPSHDLPRASGLPGDDAYECPACQGELRLPKGKKLPPYFAHNAGQDLVCTEAQVLAHTAKLLLVQTVNDWVNGRGDAPRITRHCGRCRRLKIVAPPENTAQAQAMNTSGPLRYDVVLIDGVGRELLALQVRVRKKAEQIGMPWAELVASEVLKDPLFWRPVDWGNLEPIASCEHCEKEAAAGFQTTAPLNPYVVTADSLAGKIFGPTGLLSKAMPGYEERPSQRELAEAIDQTIQKGGNLLAEGPCGTGKSAAYLSIAISHVAHTGGKVLVSTANKALMDQIYDKDLPLVLKTLGVNVKYALLKGRGNYACPTRLEQALAELDRDDPLADWALTTEDGDLERANVVIDPKVRAKIKGKTECSKHCKADACFYYQAKERASEAQVIVTNHSMLFAHLALKSRIGKAVVLPDADIVIMDEGHELADSARGFFEFTISEGYSSRAAYNEFQRREIDGTEERFFRMARKATANTGGNICEAWLNGQAQRACEEFMDATAGNAVLWREALERAQDQEADEGTLEELQIKTDRAVELTKRVLAVCELLPDKGAGSNRAFWLEDSTNNRRGVNRGVIKGCPVDVSQFIHDGLFAERSMAAIVTSATLSTSGNFDHVGKELGFVGDTKQVSSPFDFDRQSILVVPNEHDMPHVPQGRARQSFLERAAELFSWIATQTGGGVLFLFASKKSMHEVKRRVGNLPFKVLVQGDDTTKRLSEEFKLDQNACLFGLKSFWAGLDVPGHSLRCVIVEKLPFIAPDEPFQHYRQRVHGRKAAMDYMIQDAMLQLRQGVGRLVRTSSDGGAVVMLDRRVVSRYMREFSASMPWSQRHDGLGVIEHYFAPARG
jgi:ATP-dependent DNA helicase DinG